MPQQILHYILQCSLHSTTFSSTFSTLNLAKIQLNLAKIQMNLARIPVNLATQCTQFTACKL